MTTDIPETIAAEDVSEWSDDVDVIVVGFGIAGGCAAVSAAAAGASVLVLERAAAAGGTTAMAGGHFYLGGGTEVQRATGHDDNADDMYDYLVAVSREPELDKIRAYSDGSVEHFNWLEDLGFQFERSFYPGKVVVPPGTEGLSYTGNEKVWPFCERAKPAPRGHSVPVPGELGGASMVIDLLVKRADELGVAAVYETGVTNLVVEDGAVVGVRWKRFTETGTIRAKSVVIAAGGFAMNPDMVAEHTPELGKPRRTKHHGVVEPYILGNPYDDGLGIRMGVSAGGVAKNLDQMFITAAVYPPEILLTGLIVNKNGQRFVAEDSYHSRTSAYVLEQPGQSAYLIVDEAHMEMPAHAADQVPRWLRDRRRNREGARHPGGQPRRHARPLQRARCARRRPGLSQAVGLRVRHRTMAPGRCSTCRSVLRCTRASRWAGSPSHSMAKSFTRTAAWSPACTPLGRVRPTSRRTAGAMPAAPSWARDRSSAAGRAPTRRRCGHGGPTRESARPGRVLPPRRP